MLPALPTLSVLPALIRPDGNPTARRRSLYSPGCALHCLDGVLLPLLSQFFIPAHSVDSALVGFS